jgi:hypothetical protein
VSFDGPKQNGSQRTVTGQRWIFLIRHALWHPALALRLLQKTARHANFLDLEYGTIAEDCG